jgi:hypothetical protein
MLNRYIIERNITGVGKGSDEDFSKMAEKSNGVLNALGPKILWVKSYVTDDKVYCEYLAENENIVREHAKLGGFPADKVSAVKHICDPASAKDDFEALKPQTTPERQSFWNS